MGSGAALEGVRRGADETLALGRASQVPWGWDMGKAQWAECDCMEPRAAMAYGRDSQGVESAKGAGECCSPCRRAGVVRGGERTQRKRRSVSTLARGETVFRVGREIVSRRVAR